MIKEKFFLFYFVLFFNYFNFIKTEDCQIVDVPWGEIHTLKEQNDTIDGKIVSYKTKNIESMKFNCDYLTGNFDKEKQEFNILTNENFKNYEENDILRDGQITLSITCECADSNTKKVTFIQPLIDVNTHAPKFQKNKYEYIVPMPWPKTLDITMLESIIVKDIDFSNRKINFEIDENEYIEIIEDKSFDNNKQYPATLRPITHLHLVEDLTLQIHATDEKDIYGTQNTETAEVHIIIDKDGSVPTAPRFEKKIYEGIYQDTNKIDLEELVIVKDTYIESIEIEISGKYKENFNVKQIKDNKYQLEVAKPLPSSVWESDTYISLTLEIKGENTGSTIVLTLDGKNPSAPRFEKQVYEGIYHDTNKIDLEELVIVEDTYVESIEIEINGKYKENFNVKQIKDNKYQLEVAKPLPSSVWESDTYISLTLEIKGENTGSTIVLTLDGKNPSAPRFEKQVYEGIYHDTNKIDLEELVIVEDTYVESIEIEINGKYKENFNVKQIKDNKYQLEVAKPLPSSVWESDTYISLTLEIKGENTGSTIVLTLDGKKPPAPRFEKQIYEGIYQDTNKIDLEELVIVEDTYVESIEIEINGKYKENFNVKQIKDNKYQLEVAKPLPSSVWESDTYISLTLEIKGENTGSTIVLTLDGKNPSAPRFEKQVYEGIYHDTNKIDLEELVIVEDTYVESIEIEINGKYKENFNVKQIKDNKYQLEVAKPLPSSVWESDTYISLTLEIKGENTGSTIVLTLDGKKPPAPRFEKQIYEGIYQDTNKIDLEELVIVEDTYVESIEIEINGKYKENFNVKQIKDNKYQLEVAKPLPSSVWESDTYISLTLDIKGENTGCTIVLTLDGEKLPAPRFEKQVYEGIYQDTNKIDLEELVIVEETYTESIEIEISGKYSENFLVKQLKDNKYQLEVTKALPSSTWETDQYVTLTLEIKGENTGTTIVLTLDGENSPNPRFEKQVYEGIYHDTNIIDLEELVIVKDTYTESIEIEISGKYSENFNVKQLKDNKYQLEVAEPLPSSAWESDTYVSLALEIKTENSGTSVVLKLEGEQLKIPRFEKLVYPGKYSDTDKIDLEDLILAEETFVEPINIEIIGVYSKNFEIKHIKDNKYQLKVVEPLPASVWNSEEYISLSLNIMAEYTGTSIALTLVREAENPDDCKLSLTFLEPVEEFATISTDFNGELFQKKAVDFPKSKIKYSAEDKPDFIEIDETTGIVTVKNDVYIEQGVYEFHVTAENVRDGKSSYKITLYVYHKSITSKKALSVISIDEEVSRENLIELDDIDKKQNCKFEVKNVAPKGDWFQVNEKSGNIDVKEINRHDKLFDNMYSEEIQVQLTLNVNCLNEEAETKFIESFNNSKSGNSLTHIFSPNNQLSNKQNILSDVGTKQDDVNDNTYQWIYTNEISHKSEQMIINIRIENTKNHPPSFTDVAPLHVGYPNIEVIDVIHPQYVYQVHATDEDIGLNGQITYKLESTDSLFVINSKTGIIYPSKKLLSSMETNKISLNAVAVDRDGEGLASTNLPITVYMLTLEQISIMKIEKALIENLPDILNELSKKTEWSVQQLTSAVIPETDNLKKQHAPSRFIGKLARTLTSYVTGDSTDTLLTIYTYAFGKDNEIISAEDFVEKINGIKFEGVDWTVDSVEPHSNDHTIIIEKEQQSTGLLVAVIVVSVAFVCYIVGSIFFLKRRNKKNQNLVFTTKPQENIQYDSSDINPRVSVIMNDNLIGSSKTDGDESAGNTLRVNNGIRERKKSTVTFNDEVEQFEMKDQPDSLQ